MKLEDFSDEAIIEKLTRLYKKSPFYRPKYNGPRKDTDATPPTNKPTKKPNAQLIPQGKDMPKILIPQGRGTLKKKQKQQIIKKRIQTDDGYMLV